MLRGGLNVVNFAVKCSKLRLSSVATLRDSFGTEKWHYMARYFLGRALAKYDNRFNFTSNMVPSSPSPSRFYQLFLDKFAYIFNRFGCLPDDLSCKNICYWLIYLRLC